MSLSLNTLGCEFCQSLALLIEKTALRILPRKTLLHDFKIRVRRCMMVLMSK